MLDALESGSFNLSVKNKATMTLMGMYYPYYIGVSHHWLSSNVIVIHACVGFGVARSTDRAMPEPQCVGRVTDRLPRFFLCISDGFYVERP